MTPRKNRNPNAATHISHVTYPIFAFRLRQNTFDFHVIHHYTWTTNHSCMSGRNWPRKKSVKSINQSWSFPLLPARE